MVYEDNYSKEKEEAIQQEFAKSLFELSLRLEKEKELDTKES